MKLKIVRYLSFKYLVEYTLKPLLKLFPFFLCNHHSTKDEDRLFQIVKIGTCVTRFIYINEDHILHNLLLFTSLHCKRDAKFDQELFWKVLRIFIDGRRC